MSRSKSHLFCGQLAYTQNSGRTPTNTNLKQITCVNQLCTAKPQRTCCKQSENYYEMLVLSVTLGNQPKSNRRKHKCAHLLTQGYTFTPWVERHENMKTSTMPNLICMEYRSTRRYHQTCAVRKQDLNNSSATLFDGMNQQPTDQTKKQSWSVWSMLSLY